MKRYSTLVVLFNIGTVHCLKKRVNFEMV